MIKKKKKVARKASKTAGSKAKKAIKRAKPKQIKAKPRKALKSKSKAGKTKTAKDIEISLEKIGKITHYFPHVNAAAVKLLKSGLSIGDNIYLKGHTTDFKEQVRSIQLDHQPISEGKKGQEIGLFVKSRVRIGDSVYRI